MAFSAVTGKATRLPDGRQQYHVVVTNDANGNTFDDDLVLWPDVDPAVTKKTLDALTRSRLDQAKREVQSKAVALLPVGTVLDLSVPAPVVTPPTQSELDRAAFATAWWSFRRYENAVNAGIYPPSHADYLAAKDDMLATWRDGYLDLLHAL